MSQELLIILSTIIIGFVLLYFLIIKKGQSKSSDEALVEWLKTMQTSLDETNKSVNDSLRSTSIDLNKTLQENNKQINERLTKASEVIRDVSREVGQMNEIGRNMKELQEFLKSPKLRGNIGEEVLKDLISQIFPKNSFYIQYEFSTGDRVDVAIKTDAGLLPIDSKFPMENYQKMYKSKDDNEKAGFKKVFIKDVKNRIDEIAKKYILPSEGTMDFCLMYIPSESIYYEVINSSTLLDYAKNKRVYIVSPSTLYAHLQVILLSYEGKKIETKSREIFALIRELKIDYEKVNENLSTLGKHINNASNQFGKVNFSFNRIGKKLEISKSLESDIKKQINE